MSDAIECAENLRNIILNAFCAMDRATELDIECAENAAKAVIAAYRDGENEALRAKLADCQAVIRSRGHDWHCPAVLCEKCGFHQNSSWHKESNDPNDWCIFEPKDACSNACGHDRCAGDKT